MINVVKMVSNKRFFQLSERTRALGSYVDSKQFIDVYNENNNNETDAIINQYVIDNVPCSFKEIPILFSNIKSMISYHLDIPYESIYLIGSAKTGFAIDPKHFGKKFSENSDLDFAIVDFSLFNDLSQEALKWIEDYKLKSILPRSDTEKKYWDSNVDFLSRNIKRGFVDERKIPHRANYKLSRKIGDVMYQIKTNLDSFGYLKVRECSVRVYNNLVAFHSQTVINVKSVMDHLEIKR